MCCTVYVVASSHNNHPPLSHFVSCQTRLAMSTHTALWANMGDTLFKRCVYVLVDFLHCDDAVILCLFSLLFYCQYLSQSSQVYAFTFRHNLAPSVSTLFKTDMCRWCFCPCTIATLQPGDRAKYDTPLFMIFSSRHNGIWLERCKSILFNGGHLVLIQHRLFGRQSLSHIGEG